MSEATASRSDRERYDALWLAAAPELREGRVTLDSWAQRKEADARRGLTLIARPEPPVAAALESLLAELRALEPGQYHAPRADLHLTILSLLTATADYRASLAHAGGYVAAIDEALDGVAPFAVEYSGVTLAPGAVLAQGFPRGDTLSRLRERLRTALAARGLGGTVDQRYRLETAHTTLVRFTAPLQDPPRFVEALEAARRRSFGTSVVSRLELTLADYFQSSETSRSLAAFELPKLKGAG
jgi:2'-5' RNA ligase